MKRLQLRHHDEIFESRSLALEFFNNIVDLSHTASTVFGKSLYAEPMVAKYLDSESNVQLLFAIGVDSPNAPYHIIDSKEIYELIAKNEKSIEDEIERATSIESELSGSIITEIERAIAAETVLQKNIDNEVKRAISAETALNQAIEDNKTLIVPVEVSSSNVLEEFALKNALGEVLGSSIKIYKDSSLVGATTGFKGAKYVERKEDGSFVLLYDEATRDESIEYLYLIYKDENGELKLVSIDFENFLMEAEFGDGLKVIDHVASIKIKDGEKYLETNKDGLQTVGIDKAINDSVNELSESVNDKLTILDNTLNTKIDNVKDTLSGNIITLDEKIDEEIDNLETKINTDIKNLDDKLSKTIIDKELALKAEIKTNKINSKDVVLNESENGTTLEIQTDEITITKKADAGTIYDTNIAVLGSLLKIKKVVSNNTSIKSRYELQGSDGKLIGDAIELSVESALISVKQGKEGDEIDVTSGNYIKQGEGDTTMNFVYRLDDGTYELAQIVVSEYFTDSHFGKGLNNQDGVVSLKEGDGNEYLVIGEDTISVVGVNASIEKAKNEAIENSVSLANSYTDTVANGINANFETTKNFVTSEIETVSNSLGERISDLNNQINSEITTINSRLDGEIINRQNAIDSVNQNIINSIAIETQNREAALTLVNSKIDTEIVDRNNDINDVKTLINNEVKSREDEDNKILETLRNEISNAKTESILESTTSAVTTAVSEATKIATDVAAESIAKIVDGASSSYDTLKEIADWIINDTTGSAQMANDIQTLKVDTNNLKVESSTNTNNINTLTNDVNTLKKDSLKVDNDITVINEKITTLSGSVKDTVISSIDEAIIDNGLYITDVKPEDYQSGSLLRKLLYNDKTYFYASSKAEDMTLTNKSGTTVNLRDYVISLQETNNNLNTEILTLNSSIETLNNEVSGLNETIIVLNKTIEELKEQVKELSENKPDGDSVNEEQVKEIIKNYLQGVTNEIQISESESKDKLTIGFADDAIFG